ncbi:uncharacterized protein N7473_013206 [Penicillium subrubescens]|uniref:uncharacterized protein n=1 Tax=Penicillium subrubescens TaxID=1316194 RepID=UPI0025459E4B|nr:uncharacterized protein N7473_013206 [Penicillium subrubescens]KAJ5873647.1 hypothetical protein N7473_013206 [Penicillium subrubescens]
MLRQTRPIAIRWHSVISTLPSSRHRFSTRWGSLHPRSTTSLSLTKHRRIEDNEPEMPEQRLADEGYEILIPKLRHLAASLDGKSTCISCNELKDNSNRLFRLAMDDGRELIAKIPSPHSGLAFYTTASEVATMEFLRLYTAVPVPKVVAWSSEPTNEIGAEYIITEKVPGVTLSKSWDSLQPLDQYHIIERIVQIERALARLDFPAYGALYLREFYPADLKKISISDTLDRDHLFCVGKTVDAEPCETLKGFALSFIQQDLNTNESTDAESKGHGSLCLSQRRLLPQSVSNIITTLSSEDRAQKVSRPVLWHPALHLKNIIVSPDDPTRIQGITGWRSSQVLPLFLQARFPEFLGTPTFYQFGDGLPSLAGFNEMNNEEQDRALKMKSLVARSRYYEMCLAQIHELAYDAMTLDQRLGDPFQHCRAQGHVTPPQRLLGSGLSIVQSDADQMRHRAADSKPSSVVDVLTIFSQNLRRIFGSNANLKKL